MEAFAFDMLNGYAKYEGAQGIDLSLLFETNHDKGKKGGGPANKKEDCSKANMASTTSSSEQTLGTNGGSAEIGTLVKFDY